MGALAALTASDPTAAQYSAGEAIRTSAAASLSSPGVELLMFVAMGAIVAALGIVLLSAAR